MPNILPNPDVKNILDIPPPPSDPLPFHRKLPDYSPTHLINAEKIAEKIGIRKLLIKDESNRFGLPAFKVLGASWAAYRLIQLRFGVKDEDWNSADELRERLRINKLLSLLTASDGNHGRGMARVAKWFGFDARVFVPRDTVISRIEAINSEGARVTIVEGDYDYAVGEASDYNGSVAWLIQDTAWPGNERIPGWIVEGYSTIFREVREQLEAVDEKEPDVIFVQIGVGSLASSVVHYFKNRSRKERERPIIIGVEPEGAACAFESVRAGKMVKVYGPYPSIMAGLNCGTLSSSAWPCIRDGIDAFMKVDDEVAREAVRIMANNGITSGESGAGGLAGLLKFMKDSSGIEFLEAKGLDESSSVLLISTEGITDPDLYREIVEEGN